MSENIQIWTKQNQKSALEPQLSLNYRRSDTLNGVEDPDDDRWLAASLNKHIGVQRVWLKLELFEQGCQTLAGEVNSRLGEDIFSLIHLNGGKTWGAEIPGHTLFRIAGNAREGLFTQRPLRLFPLRGFSSNVLEASQAVTGSVECFWSLANLQIGYQTLPMYLHKLSLGTFVDAGMAGQPLYGDDLLVGARLELVTSFEVTWGYLSIFSLGVGWPVRQPARVDEEGPVLLLGRLL